MPRKRSQPTIQTNVTLTQEVRDRLDALAQTTARTWSATLTMLINDAYNAYSINRESMGSKDPKQGALDAHHTRQPD